jgi:hypothetical protein
MVESVDDSRSGAEGEAEAPDESSLAESDEAEEPISEAGPPRDDYVPV